MVILSRGNACAPPYPTMYTGSGDVKQKRRARRPEGEEWSEAGIRNLRQQVKYALRFFVVETALHQNPKHLSLSPPSRSAATASAQAGQSNNTKETFNNRREHNTRTHHRRIVRQHSEAGRRSTRGSMRLEVNARPKGVRGSQTHTKTNHKKEQKSYFRPLFFTAVSPFFRSPA